MSADVWEHIRSLDVTENWTERTSVISKTDHLTYTDWAREVVEEIVEQVPKSTGTMDKKGAAPAAITTADPAPPSTQSEEFQYMNQFTDDDFKGSAAQFDVGYLEKLGTTSSSQANALSRESLYQKFDPLVRQTMLNSGHKSSHFTPRGVISQPSVRHDLMSVDTPPRELVDTPLDLHSTSPINLAYSQGLQTPVTHPPSSHQVPPTSSTSSSSSSSAGCPTHSPSPSSTSLAVPQQQPLVELLKYGEEDMAAIVQRTREEERAKFEAEMKEMREEVARKERDAKRHAERVQKECQALKNEMKSHVTAKEQMRSDLEMERELNKTNEVSLEVVLTHYERLKEQVKEIEQQRDTALKDFEGLDKSFADLHQRYLKLKQLSDTQQQNEKALKAHIAELKALFQESEEKLQQLVTDSMHQQNKFTGMVESMKREHSQDVAVTKATVKKLELQVSSLQRALEEREIEKKELTGLCDELFAQINQK